MGTSIQPNDYLPVKSDESQTDIPVSKERRLWGPVLVTVVSVLSVILILAVVNSNEKDILSPTPEIPYTQRIFTESPSFENLSTPDQVSDAWGKYGLPSYGFIHLPSPQIYNLPPNQNVIPGTSNTYMVSVYHQLHCLKALHMALLPTTTISPPEVDHGFGHNHIEHCLDYLRQAVMCAGDLTLEPPDETPEEGKSPLQGWGVKHVCRSWEGIERWRGERGVI